MRLPHDLRDYAAKLEPAEARAAYVLGQYEKCVNISPHATGRARRYSAWILGCDVSSISRAIWRARDGDLSRLVACAKPFDIDNVGYIYYADSLASGLTKIGFSRDPARRMKELERDCGERMKIIWTAPATMLIEHRAHCELRQYRKYGEWFDLDPIRLDRHPKQVTLQ